MPPTEPSDQHAHDTPRKRRGVLWRALFLSRARRRWRWTVRLAIAIPLLLIAAYILLTHSALTRVLILPRIAKATGLAVDADSIHIRRDGKVVMERAEFTIPGVAGDAGRFLKIAEVEVTVDWWKTLGGAPNVGLVKLTDPVLIVSQSLDDGTLNVGQVPVPATQKSGMLLPGIIATNAWVELGEHSGGGSYTRLKRIKMDGSLMPQPDAPGVYGVALHETAQRRSGAPGPGFTVTGTVSEGTIDLNLVNFMLSDWPSSTLPRSIREIAEGLELTGEVPQTHFTYTTSEGITASMQLRGVAMNLPLEAAVQGPELPTENPAPIRYMRMSNVDGSITFARDSVVAKVGGLIEDLPYEVTLRYDGVTDDSPFRLEFTSKDFLISRNPELLLYAPPTVKYYLKAFLMPTGLITTHVNVARGPPIRIPGSNQTEPGPLSVSGSIDFREGTAAYESFPYEFTGMTGRFEFDNQEIRILNVTGRSSTGAKLHARGRIGPLDESSEVDIYVHVTEAQIDEAMEAAFGPDRGKVITALFNEQRHQELLDAGLIRTPEQAAAEEQELTALESGAGNPERIAELKRRQQVPVFDFRGRADVTVHVYSPRGVGTEYITSVDVALPRVGIIPEKFPYPLIAEDIAVEVRNQKGRLIFGTFRGLAGGRATVEATFSVPGKSDTGPAAPPDIRIQAADLPFDALLLHALPGGASGFKRIMRDLNLSAAASGEVHITGRETRDASGEAELGFDASVKITSGEARPASLDGGDAVAIADLQGSFEASERQLSLDLEGVPVRVGPDVWMSGELVGPPPPLLPGTGAPEDPRIGGTLTVHIRGEFPEEGKDAPADYFIHATCPTFDLDSKFESLVHIFAPDAAKKLVEARQTYRPEGFVDVRVETEIGASTDPRILVELSNIRSLGVDLLNRRIGIAEGRGSVSLNIAEASEAHFESFAGPLVVGRGDDSGAPAGTVLVDGRYPLGEARADSSQLQIALLDGRFDSELTRAILEQVGGADPNGPALSWVEKLKPSGTFDANIEIRPGKSGPEVVRGRIDPRTLDLEPGGKRVALTKVGGSVEFEKGGGTLRGLRLEAPDWSVTADGVWTGGEAPGGSGLKFRSSIDASGNKLSDDLRALMPEDLRTLFDDLQITITGPFNLSDATLDLDRSPTGAASTKFNGRLNFAGVGLEAGAPISNMDGAILINFERGAGEKPASFDLDLRADRFDVAGISLTEGSAAIRSGPAPGQVRITDADGACHGGRLHVRADVMPEGSSRRVNAEFRLSGVRFSTFLRELVHSVKPLVGPPAPLDGEEADPQSAQARRRDEFSRGLMDAELTLTTLASDPASRRGRGTLRISGGRILNLPVMTGLIEALNLQLPFNARLDFAWASLFIEGGLITFEELSVQSSSIELAGGGTMTWPDRELDLRLQSRSARPIPILSAIVQGIRHQLVVTTVTGKLGEQQVGIQTPGPARMIDGIMGGADQNPRTGQVGEDQRSVVPERARERSGKRGIRPQPPGPRQEEPRTVAPPH